MIPLHHFSIPEDHPALAGHFPGNPIVPASMVLEQVIAAWNAPFQGVRSAKFLRPLRGNSLVQIAFEVGPADGLVRFTCSYGGEFICTGELMASESA